MYNISKINLGGIIMRKPQPLKPESKERLSLLLKKSETKLEFQRIQCLWLRSSLSLSSQDIATAIGWNPSSVRRIQASYLKKGETALLVNDRGGRHRENMSIEEEKELLEPFFREAKKGKVLVVKEIKLSYEDKVGYKVAKSTIYRMLVRHGWRKISPGPHHPKAYPAKQKEFKKKSQR
jgi:transposase